MLPVIIMPIPDAAQRWYSRICFSVGLSPQFLNDLVESKINEFIDFDEWDLRKSEISSKKRQLQAISDGFRG